MAEIQEYRRKCKSCGKVWNSLVSRESAIKSNVDTSGCQVCLSTCNSQQSAQYQRNLNAEESELQKLRQCPDCKSSAYDEEIITYNE